MAELRVRMQPKVNLAENKQASEVFGPVGKRKLKQYSVYLPPEYILWLKRRALELKIEQNDSSINVSRLLTDIVEEAIKKAEKAERGEP